VRENGRVPRRLLIALTFALAVTWLAIDQCSKVWAETALLNHPRIPILGGWFGLVLVHNPGAAFGLGTGYIWILTVIAGIAVLALAVLAFRVRNLWWALVIGSMLGGAISHFLDRLLRGDTLADGRIVDFIDWGGFFVGNIADIALVAAAIGAVLLSFLGVSFSEAERPAPGSSPQAPADQHE
jgi:signal peptidase II